MKYIAIILLTILTSIGFAQDTAYYFIHGGIGNETLTDIDTTFDDGIIVIGSTGSFGSGTSDAYLVKLDSDCNYEWSKTIGSSNVDWGTSIKPTLDTGFVFTGYTNSWGNGGYDMWLVKTNAAGDTLWTRTYGGNSWEMGNSVARVYDGGYVIAGWTNSYGNGGSDVYVVRTDANGDTLWTNTYGGTKDDVGHSIIQTADSNFVVTGGTKSFGHDSSDVYLIKMDDMGNVLWDSTYGYNGYDIGYAVTETYDQGYMIAGTSDNFNNNTLNMYVVKTDVNGVGEYKKSAGGLEDAEGYDVMQLSDSSFAFLGFTKSYGAGKEDFYAMHLDKFGAFINAPSYGDTEDDAGIAIAVKRNGDLVYGGTTDSWGAGFDDIILIKIDTMSTNYDTILSFSNDPLFVNELEEEIGLQVYPNPFSDYTNVVIDSDYSKLDQLVFVMRDISGREVLQYNISAAQTTIYRGDLPTGMYLYEIRTTEAPIATGKLIVR